MNVLLTVVAVVSVILAAVVVQRVKYKIQQVTNKEDFLAEIAQKQIGKYVELTNADYPDGRILFSGKIVDIMFYKPYNRVCTIVDTKGGINTYSTQDRGDILVLFNRYEGDSLINARVVNTFVPSNNISITSEEPCLEYSDFMLFCDLKYKIS